MKRLLVIILLSYSAFFCSGQYFETGQDPASIRWRQINTLNFQLIYPSDFETKAQRLAHVLEKVYDYGSKTMNHQPKKISIILHTHNIKTNGLVALAPKRAEFFSVPDQSIYPQNWLDQLALHEFRHVVQIDKVESQLPWIIKLLLGEQGAAAVIGAYLPFWLIEGDAVVTETALSNYGRGRQPSFEMETKAQLVEKGIYSLNKAYLGSYKSYVPDHYNLGYYLVGGARVRYGPSIWELAFSNVGLKPFSFAPLNNTLLKQTGLNQQQLYRSVFDSLRNKWSTEDQVFQNGSYQIVTNSQNSFNSYTYNHYFNENEIISYKTSFNRIPRFVKIGKDGKEETCFVPGRIFSESVSYNDNLLIWSERLPDVRWSHSGGSLVRIYDLKKGTLKEFKTGMTSVAPVISPGKAKIAFVETDKSNNHSISIYSIDGQIIEKFTTQENCYFLSPCWLNDGQLALLMLQEEGKRFATLELKSGRFEIISTPDLGDIKQLHSDGNYIYFISSYAGKDELYAMEMDQDSIFRVFTARFGSNYPAIDSKNNKILISDYTSDGYRLIEIPVQPELWEFTSKVERANYPFAGQLAKDEKGIPDFREMDTSRYISTKYSKIGHIFQIHSWAPVFIDVNNYSFQSGASLMSQNKLGTSQTILGYKWEPSEKTGQYYLKFTYKGIYPVFSTETSTGKRAKDFDFIINTVDQRGNIIKRDTTTKRITWNETNLSFDSYLPLNLAKGKFNRLFQPGLTYTFQNRADISDTSVTFLKSSIHSLTYNLYYHQFTLQAYQDMYPDFGVVFDLKYRQSLSGGQDYGNLICGQSLLYFPGLIATHGIKLYGGIQHKNSGYNYHSFSDIIRYPRGWERITTIDMVSLGFDYKFPLAYPDFSLEKFVYLKRVKSSFFADWAYLRSNRFNNGNFAGTFTRNLSSVGIELTGDLNLMRFFAPLDIGFRAGYLPEAKRGFMNLLLSVNFSTL